MATVWAEAPGYCALIRTEGGAICGYCAIGSVRIDRTPIPMMRIEITQAKTGRSMKNRAMISVPVPAGYSDAASAVVLLVLRSSGATVAPGAVF